MGPHPQGLPISFRGERTLPPPADLSWAHPEPFSLLDSPILRGAQAAAERSPTPTPRRQKAKARKPALRGECPLGGTGSGGTVLQVDLRRQARPSLLCQLSNPTLSVCSLVLLAHLCPPVPLSGPGSSVTAVPSRLSCLPPENQEPPGSLLPSVSYPGLQGSRGSFFPCQSWPLPLVTPTAVGLQRFCSVSHRQFRRACQPPELLPEGRRTGAPLSVTRLQSRLSNTFGLLYRTRASRERFQSSIVTSCWPRSYPWVQRTNEGAGTEGKPSHGE